MMVKTTLITLILILCLVCNAFLPLLPLPSTPNVYTALAFKPTPMTSPASTVIPGFLTYANSTLGLIIINNTSQVWNKQWHVP